VLYTDAKLLKFYKKSCNTCVQWARTDPMHILSSNVKCLVCKTVMYSIYRTFHKMAKACNTWANLKTLHTGLPDPDLKSVELQICKEISCQTNAIIPSFWITLAFLQVREVRIGHLDYPNSRLNIPPHPKKNPYRFLQACSAIGHAATLASISSGIWRACARPPSSTRSTP
jgi:hypothetical protein